MICLLDGDIVLYRCGFASMDAPEDVALMRADIMVNDILRDTRSTSYKMYLSDSLANNYRIKYNPDYKANRKNSDKPVHYDALKLFLQQEFKAEITRGQEADDQLGIEQTSLRNERLQGWTFDAPIKQEGKNLIESMGEPCVICSIDKDLLAIPGKHYNFVKKEFKQVTYDEGLKFFYKQLLIGDRVDNITGIDGIGPVKAAKFIDKCDTEEEMFSVVQGMYDDDARLLKNGVSLWIRREENEDWSLKYMTLLEATK